MSVSFLQVVQPVPRIWFFFMGLGFGDLTRIGSGSGRVVSVRLEGRSGGGGRRGLQQGVEQVTDKEYAEGDHADEDSDEPGFENLS